MYAFLWLIPLLPFLGFLINALFVRQERAAGLLASATVAVSFVIGVAATVMLAGMPEGERRMTHIAWMWVETGAFQVPFGLLFDPLTAVMVLLVTGVGALIHVYSIGYMHGDARVVRYFAYLNLFVSMMLVLVMADNLLLLFLGWEGVGLCSFLLIGHWFERRSASGAAVKAFVVNRIGDAAFLLAMMAIFSNLGTLNFYRYEWGGQVFEGFAERAVELSGRNFGPAWQTIPIATGIALLLLLAAAGKSAQLPLFVWLPDAMAGPTPVSALIHAATMVTGGVYLMARTEGIFQLSLSAQGWVVWIGTITAFIAATAALTQWDIKRVLAYSTISQLGYMVAACGMGIYAAAIFHLLTHGLFKALLFLGSGSVIHGTHDTQDMRRMGGLRRAMPTTFWTYMVGSLALAGIFPLAGFWSKDEILSHAATSGRIGIFLILFTTSLLTGLYMGRQVALVFFGTPRDSSIHPHESGRVMTVPLVALAVATAIGGIINLPVLHWLSSWLEPVLREPALEFGVAQIVLATIATLASAGMFYLGYWYYTTREARIKVGGKDPLYRYSGDVWDAMEEAWYVDRAYERYTVVPGVRWLSSFLARVFDPEGVDGLVRGVGRIFGVASLGLRALQTGYVRTYALFFLVGVVVIIGFLVLR